VDLQRFGSSWEPGRPVFEWRVTAYKQVDTVFLNDA
jgi:hypothetical protein